MSTSEFDEEIQSLTQQLKDKITTLRKDYNDLKIFQNKADIASAREKLIFFIKKLMNNTQEMINTCESVFNNTNSKIEKKITESSNKD